MRSFRCFSAFVLATLSCQAAIDADSRRGAELFVTQGCVSCHEVDGKGGRTAPDLSRRISREYTAAGIASRMWNHAPTMWSAIRKAEQRVPALTQEDSANLLAFFYAARYFEHAGDAGRGRRVFTEKKCAGCHGLSGPSTGEAKSVTEWDSLTDPVQLVQRMWIHSSTMRKEIQTKNMKWPAMTGQEFNDLLVYLQNLPSTRTLPYHFLLPREDQGNVLIESKGCTKCHVGALSLDHRLSARTLTDVAAAMWNHAPKMTGAVPSITSSEMRQIIAEIWARQFFNPEGDVSKGERVYQAKCDKCHSAGGAPAITKSQSAITMVSALWTHGPKMLEKVKEMGEQWPKLSPTEMANVIAYLDSKK
ncbi:MAG: c-type cytochrome [Bryobacteraceae bacterium]